MIVKKVVIDLIDKFQRMIKNLAKVEESLAWDDILK